MVEMGETHHSRGEGYMKGTLGGRMGEEKNEIKVRERRTQGVNKLDTKLKQSQQA